MKLKKEHLENLIDLAMCLSMQTNDPVDHSVAGIKEMGVKQLTFDAFDTRKIDEYASQAKASWGTTPAYKEYEKRSKGRTKEDDRKIHQGMIDIFAEFGQIRHTDPASEEAQAMAKKLQDYITERGKMYACGGDFTTNIDKIGGEGTAVFASQAIEVYCK